MKLRIRSLETKETLRIEAPDHSSLLGLKTLIAVKVSSSITPESIRLSLNRKDELVSSSPHDSPQSLGLTSGDLLFYSFDADPQAQTPMPSPVQSHPVVESPKNPNSDTFSLNDPLSQIPNPVPENPNSNSSSGKNPVVENSNALLEITSFSSASLEDAMEESSTTVHQYPPQELAADQWEDGMEVDEEEPAAAEKPPSVPGFLKRVLEEEKEALTSDVKLLVIAVHAVFLESGFMAVGGDGYRLPGGWTLAATNVSIQYTVPDLVGCTNGGDVKNAYLKFITMGKYATIYGYLSGDRPDSYRLCLDVKKLTPLLVSSTNAMSKEEGELFQLWKTVKDGLSLPLLIDICAKNGLPSPPCFMRLPTDLKIKILDLLPGVDVARVGSTCSELRYISSNDELWEQEYVEEFGLLKQRGVTVRSWKDKYAKAWVAKKNAEKRTERVRVFGIPSFVSPRYFPVAPQRFPMTGGDYDRFPAIGQINPMGPRIGFPQLPARRNFSPHCNLGGFNG